MNEARINTTMKNQISIATLLLVVGCQTQPTQTEDIKPIDTQALLQDAQQTAQTFTQELGGTLKQHIQTQGVVSAIPFCKQVAPAIANKHSTETKVVKRVSTKARNRTQGIPDAWEQNALASFAQQVQTAAKDAPLEQSQVTTENGQRYFRYAKAIKIQAMCLKCHGQEQDIAPDVRNALSINYPQDIARGYKEGDLRGAVSIKYTLK